ncbi:MAG: DUF2242 domain-containing protein [Rhodocyclaceae bacterium]|nr:DUF2242 domain-containing protein [Rhodocyclaceae bacterium]
MMIRPTSLIFLSLLLGACATNKPAPAWRAEAFSEETPFEYRTSAAPPEVCSVGQRALLSQGYQVDSLQAQMVKARKYFEPSPGHHMELSISLVCLPTQAGSVLYASALQTRYELKTSTANASVSVGGMGSISLPWLSDKDSLVKVGEETVSDPDFYRRLFALIQSLEDITLAE